MIVIISCGKAKQSRRCRAGEMYRGNYFRQLLAYARVLTDDAQIFILSGKYGLLRLSDEIDPYDLRLGQSGSVSVWTVRQQARRLMISYNKPITMLCTGRYANFVRRVFVKNQITAPLEGLGGIGYQKHFLSEHTPRKVRQGR